MTDSLQRLQRILKVEHGNRLEEVVDRKISSPLLASLNSPEQAIRFIRSNLRGSYLFSRFLVPAYAGFVFSSLTKMPPISDVNGPLILAITEVVRGELTNNNIFERAGECHSHYSDALEAYRHAEGNMEEVYDFCLMEQDYGVRYAISHSALWSPKSRTYAEMLLKCCEEPLPTFALMSVNEELAPRIYEQALSSLSSAPKFDRFRRFMERHVEFDKGDHGPATIEWLEYFIKNMRVSPIKIREASDLVLRTLNL